MRTNCVALSLCLTATLPSAATAQQHRPIPFRMNPRAHSAAARLQAVTLVDSAYHRARRIWIYTPRDYAANAPQPYPLLVAFDGVEYQDTMPLPLILDTLRAAGKAPAFVAVLIDNGGGAERIANEFNGEVVQSDQVPLRQLPAALQEMMLPMQVGQATQPFGSIEEGVRVLFLCGRDQADTSAPTFDDVYAQLNEERVNLRSRRYLRDLRRDAVIEYR